MKLFWQKAEVQKFEHAKDFAEEYNIGKNDFILASKSTYETYFAPLGLEAHVEFKSKYGKGEPTDVMIDALLADFRKTDCDRIIAIGGGAVIDMAKILVLAGNYTAEEIFGRKVPLKREDSDRSADDLWCRFGSFQCINCRVYEVTYKDGTCCR
ncbi:MAG: iron-containing alcohol dehydrogenase [Dorea longicatena]